MQFSKNMSEEIHCVLYKLFAWVCLGVHMKQLRLSEYFKPVPHITNYQHFRLNSDEQGIITLRKTIDAEDEKITLIKEKKDLIDFKKKKLYPKKILKPEGLSPKRQWYLYEEIREHMAA